MEKKYKRTPDIYIIVFIVGLIVVIDSFRIQNFVWLYDGIKFLVALIIALYGLWGLLVPYATIEGKKLRVNSTLFKTKEFDLEKDTHIHFDDRQDTIEINDSKKSQVISTRNIKKHDRGSFKSDLQQYQEEQQE